MNRVWLFRFIHTLTSLFTNPVSAVEAQQHHNIYLSQNRALLIVQNFAFLLIFAIDSIGIPFGALHSLRNCECFVQSAGLSLHHFIHGYQAISASLGILFVHAYLPFLSFPMFSLLTFA